MRRRRIHNRILCVLSAAVLLLSLAGCKGGNGTAAARGYVLYYLNEDENQIRTERFAPMDTETNAMILELVALQRQSPKNDELHLLLPAGVELLNYDLEDETLTLNFNAAYGNMAPGREILTRAGLVRTFVQVDGVSRVALSIDGKPMKDQAGNEVGPMTAASFLENAGKEINAYQRTTLVLYFADETGGNLVSERHPVYYISNEPLEKVVLEELKRGPSEAGHSPVLAATTNILSVTSQDQTCYVNFEGSPAGSLVTATEEVQVFAIVNSLIENCSVNKVQLSIGGESDVVFQNEISLKQSFEKNTSLIRE